MYKKYKTIAVKYFIFFLIYVVLVDLIGSYTRYVANFDFLKGLKERLVGTVFERNFWWYTIFWYIGSALFYAFYFEKIITSYKNKAILRVSKWLFLSFSVAFILFNWESFFIKPLPAITISSSALILLGGIMYFLEMLRSEKILTFYRSLNFYISSTLLIWLLIITPIVFYNVYFSNDDRDFVLLKWQIYLIANTFMYFTFTFALLWCKPQND